MTQESMTVHKALCELKMLSKRIHEDTRALKLVASRSKMIDRVNGVPEEEFRKEAISNWQSVNSLINRRNAIKKAVTQSNSSTKVLIGNLEYSVAEAIEMKSSGMQHKIDLMNVLKIQYERTCKEVDSVNKEVAIRAEDFVNPKNGKDGVKVDPEAVAKMRKDFYDNNSYFVIDPIKALENIKSLETEINSFLSEVDSTLSVSNALTVIEINY